MNEINEAEVQRLVEQMALDLPGLSREEAEARAREVLLARQDVAKSQAHARGKQVSVNSNNKC